MVSRRQALKALGLPFLAGLAPAFVAAQTTTDSAAAKYANNIHLGYMRTSSGQINSDTQRGMEALADHVGKRRTSVRVAGAVALDPDQDDLSFFQFIYWPVTPDARALSEKARARVQHYIDSGGVILFDMRSAGGAMRDPRALRRLLADINIKPLQDLPKDHTLTKTFYLLSALPGSSAHGNVSVEVLTKGIENISSVIIGDNNWADAWAGKSVLPGTREHDMAMRAGVNMVLYAYGGRFKDEPIHETLERMNR